MMKGLVASQPVRAHWLGGTTVSTVTHGALAALLVTSGATTISSVHEERAAAPFERVTYVRPALLSLPKTALKGKSGIVAPMHAKPAKPRNRHPDVSVDVATLRLEMNASAPQLATEPDLTAVIAAATHDDELPKPAQSLAALVAANAAFTRPESGAYTEDLVDRGVVARAGNPKPKYPSSLADQGVGGQFLVKFVVDSTGRVADDQIQFPSTMHRLFAAAVRNALLESRYSPAMVAGRFVAEQVRQEFRFTVVARRK